MPEEVELNSTFSGTGGALPPGPQTPELNVSMSDQRCAPITTAGSAYDCYGALMVIWKPGLIIMH